MTWTSSAYSAAETTARTSGRPWLMATHVAERAAVIWTSDTGEATDTDESDPATPAHWTTDRRGGRVSSPTGTAATWYLVIGPILYDPPLIAAAADTIVLLDHNLNGATVIVEGAESADFGTGYEELHSFTVTQTGRWADHFAARWQADAGDYLRLTISMATPFTPAIGEVWIGRRRQLRGGLLTGRDRDGVSSAIIEAAADHAFATRRERAPGRQSIDMRLRVLDNHASLSDSDALARWWAETDGGARSFLWSREPTSTAATQHEARLMVSEATDLNLPRNGWHGDRVLEQRWTELPPFRATET